MPAMGISKWHRPDSTIDFRCAEPNSYHFIIVRSYYNSHQYNCLSTLKSVFKHALRMHGSLPGDLRVGVAGANSG